MRYNGLFYSLETEFVFGSAMVSIEGDNLIITMNYLGTYKHGQTYKCLMWKTGCYYSGEVDGNRFEVRIPYNATKAIIGEEVIGTYTTFNPNDTGIIKFKRIG